MLSNPVSGNLFFGREGYLSLLKKRAQAHQSGYRQNIALFGSPLVGKTSVLYHFLRTWDNQAIIPAYVCVKGINCEQFINRFSSAVLYNYLKIDGKEIQEDHQFLLKSAKKALPKTTSLIEKAKESLKKKEHQTAFSLILDMPAVLTQETGKKSLVILDEFHELENIKVDNPFALLAKKIMVQKDVMYIITSSMPMLAKKILSKKLHLLFGNFELKEMNGFDIKTSREYLRYKLGSENLTDKFFDFLIALTQGNPFYLENISQTIKNIPLISFQKIFTPEELIVRSLESLLFEPSGILSMYFQQITASLPRGRNTKYLQILLALADNCCKMKDLAKKLSKGSKDLSKQILKLAELEIVEKSGTFYRIQDQMYKFWLQKVYLVKKNSFIPNSYSSREQFRKDLLTQLAEFAENSKRPLPEIVADLFKSFGNETVELDQRHLILPHFVHVEQKTPKEDEKFVSARGEKHWVCFIKDKQVNEQDVAKFASRCKGFRRNVTKKIIVALDGMDMNAKLLAKEEKFWPWTISDLNLLLDFYNKTPLIK